MDESVVARATRPRRLAHRVSWTRDESERTVRIKIVLAAGLTLIAIAAVAVLLHSPETVAATNGIAPTTALVSARENAQACQAGETIPAGTTAIRLQIVATTGPRVSVQVRRGRHLLSSGTLAPPWYGAVVTVPIAKIERVVRHATVCFQLSELSGAVQAYGSPTPPAQAAHAAGKSLPGRISINYLRPGPQSWLSLAGGVAEHMELGRAASGSAIVVVIAALAAAAIALGAWTTNRELG